MNILLVGETGSATADRLRAIDDRFSVDAVPPSAAVDRVTDGTDDCVVVAGGVEDPAAALEQLAAAAPSVPRLAAAGGSLDASAAIGAGATDVVPLDDPAVSARRIENVVFRRNDDSRDEVESETKIRRLHSVAAELDRTETEAEIYDLVVRVAEDILEFDICYVGVVEDGEIRPKAANRAALTDDPVIMSVEEGIAGKTVRTGRTFVVDDASTDPDADPVDDTYRSCLSIPVGDFGVLQTVATEVAAYTEQDRTLGELLVSHLESAVERVRYEATLRHERDRFAALFENVPDAVVRTRFVDDEPIVEAVNPVFERLFGFEADEVVGESLDDVVVPADRQATARRLNESVREGDRLDEEVERLTADGPRQFLLRNAPFSRGEDHVGWAIYTDIENLKRRERELQRQNERLEEFAAMVSHDLRSPLNVATGRVTSAREALPTDGGESPAATHLDEAAFALDRMDRLIDDLLALARKGRVVDDPEPTDLAALVERAWWGVDAPDAGLDVADLPTVPADASRVQELFENLFRNAVQHGGPEVTVTVGRLDDGFFVADDGVGIPDAERGNVFDAGFTTEEEGTGIGLAIVEEIAAAHGWSVRATEAPAGGARFEFDLTDGAGEG